MKNLKLNFGCNMDVGVTWSHVVMNRLRTHHQTDLSVSSVQRPTGTGTISVDDEMISSSAAVLVRLHYH